MKPHTKIYTGHFGIFSPDQYLPCEWCDLSPVVDVNHIEPRGMGGKNPRVDVIDNLVGLCRPCHLLFEAKKISKQELREKHLANLKR